MGSIIDATILHHVGIVLISLWLLNCYNYCHPVAYLISLIYLYLVHEGYVLKLRKNLQFEEKRDANRRRVLLDSETVRWLNHAVEKMWLVCLEEIVSQKILLPIAPWFLKKYKPWTAKDIEIQHFYLGRSPPMFTEIRVLRNSNSDDHLVLEIGMNFLTADDMSAILSVKLRKRLGFGMWAKLHLLGMHIEGKVLVGVKFLRGWPFIGRLRICFASPPYFQMTVKPVFNHGLDVTEIPGISGWIDNLLALVFEQTLVEPNMLVVDVEKLVSPQSENWFSVDAKEPVAHAIVEVLEGAEMKPSDLNGLADPYVKGKLGHFRFRTKIQKKTLVPKWLEEFKIPICSWDSRNILHFEVRDKDHVFDDMMGDCCVNINELRDGQRHDIWLPLRNIKMGRLHIAVTVFEANGKGAEPLDSKENPQSSRKRVSFEVDPALACLDAESAQKILEDISQTNSSSPRIPEMYPKIADKFEWVEIEGYKDAGIWIQQPGSEVAQVWEPREGKTRDNLTSHVKGMAGENDDSSSSDESMEPIKHQSKHRVRRGLKKIGSMFQKDKGPCAEDKSSTSESSPKAYVREIKSKKAGVRLIIDDTHFLPSPVSPKDEKDSLDENELASPRGNVKHMAKSILKQAGKSARELKSVLSRKQSTKHNVGPISLPTLEPNASNDDTSSSTSTEREITESGLLIHGSTIDSPSPVSSSKSFKSKNDVIQKTSPSGNSSGNNAVDSVDNTIQTSENSGNNAFLDDNSADSGIQKFANSGGNALKSDNVTG